MNTSGGQTRARYFQASGTRFAAAPIYKIESRCKAFRMPNFSTVESNPWWKEDPREGGNMNVFLARIMLSCVQYICFRELKILVWIWLCATHLISSNAFNKAAILRCIVIISLSRNGNKIFRWRFNIIDFWFVFFTSNDRMSVTQDKKVKKNSFITFYYFWQ